MISGLQMLLHQAFSQVEQFTGRPAPAAADGGCPGLRSAVVSDGGLCRITRVALTLSAVDIRERRLPNRLTLTGAVVIVAGAAAYGRGVAHSWAGLPWLGCIFLCTYLIRLVWVPVT